MQCLPVLVSCKPQTLICLQIGALCVHRNDAHRCTHMWYCQEYMFNPGTVTPEII